MKKKTDKTTRLAKFKRFLIVNLFVQKLRFRAFGLRWYLIDLFETFIERGKPILETILTGLVINEVQKFVLHTSSSLTTFYWLMGIILAQRIFTSIYSTYHDRFIPYKLDFAFPKAIEKEIMTKLIYLNWEHIEDPKTEKNIQMAYTRSLQYLIKLGELHIDIIILFFTLIPTFIFAQIPLWIFLLSLAKQIPSIIATAIGAKLAHAANDKTQDDWNIAGSVFRYFRNFRTLLELKVSRASEKLLNIYEQKRNTVEKVYLENSKKMVYPWMAIMIYEAIINTGISVYYLLQVLYSGMLLGTYQYTTGIITQTSNQIYALMVRINGSFEYYRYVVYLYDLVTLENRVTDGTKELATENITIEFRDVWFKYPLTKRYSLKNINVTIEDNARLAIVGENGAGKSTFLKLLNGIYPPTKGEILVNGIPLQEYKQESYHKKIAMVTQEFARYDTLTIADNITMYEQGLNANQEKIEQAAKLAEAYEFINSLPNKFLTPLTKTLEGGTELSSGQWQRLAIARQFYANRALIILDEPTSAIDPLGESRIFNNLYTHLEKKTVIVVSHRYNTVRSAKEILVFNKAQIIERGTHDELLALNGYYAEAYQVQQEEKKL